MKATRLKTSLSALFCGVLIAATALLAVGCGNQSQQEPESSAVESISSTSSDVTAIGQGKTTFLFSVIDETGAETQFAVHTDKTIVGEALQELGLIDGEEGPYGLYVKKVNGITADAEKDGKYWAFRINGEYATAGVDSTEIKSGDVYSFQVENV
ncbi:MAG: DUF4430 domain-containing protein [Oscillospiraceae bacterium]|nr:DUF4430 domain-containing protein [Oscillospiraceae bacterium]